MIPLVRQNTIFSLFLFGIVFFAGAKLKFYFEKRKGKSKKVIPTKAREDKFRHS